MARRWNHPSDISLSEVVARHVTVYGDCLLWTGRKHRGYPTLFWGVSPRVRSLVVKRLWESQYGPLPARKRLWCHCGHRDCVRLEHWKVQGVETPMTRARITVEYLVEMPGCVDTRLLQTLVAGQLLERGLPAVDGEHPVSKSYLGGKPEPLVSVQVREDRPGFAGSTCLFNATTGKRRLVKEGHLGNGPRPTVEEVAPRA